MSTITLRYTLVSDGPSDRGLLRILNWVLQQMAELSGGGFVDQFADFRHLDVPPRGLAERLCRAIELFPCDVLFVHRDAETQTRAQRVDEIQRAAQSSGIDECVRVVPVRMTEAWLLIDEKAIRAAAGNPNGTYRLELPRLRDLESTPDPKDMLQKLLISASDFRGRRQRKFARELSWRSQRVAELIEDFTPLRQLPAFQAFEDETRHAIVHGAKPRPG